MSSPHPNMKPKLREDLEESRWISRPMRIHWEDTKDAHCAAKKVLRSRYIHNMQSLDGWEAVTPYATLSLSKEHVYPPFDHSVCFRSPCKLKNWTNRVGRIYAVPKAYCRVDKENWEDYNRLTAWIYPDMPGYRNVCVRLQLHNEGKHPVPDAFDREGGHNLNLQNHTWNRVQFEIPYVARDEVVGVSIDYDMVGNEPCANGEACWYIGALILEEVESPEHFEGWMQPRGQIAYSHLGYQPGAEKTAIACGIKDSHFNLIDAETRQIVYTGIVENTETTTGQFSVMDFTPFSRTGTYRLQVDGIETEPFDIDPLVWMDSIWKTINFVFFQRCGFRVPGKHEACHSDRRSKHGDREIVANGGWHDAADTNQQVQLTCEATHAFFELAMKLENEDPLLSERLMDEGIWGLNYLLQTRFGDGYRTGPTSSAVWTDGIRGTCDDLTFDAINAPFANLFAASAEVMGSRALEKSDPVLSQYALQCAIADFRFSMEIMEDPSYDPNVIVPGHDKLVSPCLMASLAARTAMELYEATHDESFAEHGAKYGDYIVSCQQRTLMQTEIGPLCGFFYRDPSHKTAIHYNHRSYEDNTTLALIGLCKNLKHHPHYMAWQSALLYFTEYVKRTMFATAPYGMLPSGVYSLDEIDDRETFSLMHPIFVMFAGKDEAGQRAETFLHYTEQLEQGIRLDERNFLRRFPVWYSFRGNYHVQLSLGKAVSAASVFLNDVRLYQIAQEQFAWIIGKNPFSESMMFGTGYNYGTQYAVMHGDAVGELPVGMQSNNEFDAPFWPQANNCTYKEVWMGPPGKWFAMMADEYLPGRVIGCNQTASPTFVNESTGESFTAESGNGNFSLSLPAGSYLVTRANEQMHLSVVAGNEYTLPAHLCDFTIDVQKHSKQLEFTLNGTGEAALFGDNLEMTQTQVLLSEEGIRCTVYIRDINAPWSLVMLPELNKN